MTLTYHYYVTGTQYNISKFETGLSKISTGFTTEKVVWAFITTFSGSQMYGISEPMFKNRCLAFS